MNIDLDNLNPGTWFYFDDKDHSQGRVCLRTCPAAELKKIRKATHKISYKFRHGQRFESVDVDELLEDKLLWDYCIVDWEGVNNNGQALECTPEIKSALMGGVPAFASFVTSALTELGSLDALAQEEAEKNC